MSKRYKDAEKFSKGSAVRHKQLAREDAMSLDGYSRDTHNQTTVSNGHSAEERCPNCKSASRYIVANCHVKACTNPWHSAKVAPACAHLFTPNSPSCIHCGQEQPGAKVAPEPPTPPRGSQLKLATILCGAANILDVVKQEWGESWSEWDQSIRDGITELLKETYDV